MRETHRGEIGHFHWCPLKYKSTSSFCLCIIAIYALMGLIGGGGAYGEYKLGALANAYTPQGDAWHLATDTAGDFIAGIIMISAMSMSAMWGRRVQIGGAYIQALLLLLAAALIAYEALERASSSAAISPFFMLIAGIVGIAANALRLWLLHLPKGAWNITRFIQDKHVRSDLYLSIAAAGSGIAVLFLWFIVKNTDISPLYPIISKALDFAVLIFIFLYIIRWAAVALRKAFLGEVEYHP